MIAFTYTMSANLYVNSYAGTHARKSAVLPPPSQDAPASAAGEGWGGGSARDSSNHAESNTISPYTYTKSAPLYVKPGARA